MIQSILPERRFYMYSCILPPHMRVVPLLYASANGLLGLFSRESKNREWDQMQLNGGISGESIRIACYCTRFNVLSFINSTEVA